jgi:hypothetical protein
MAKKQETYQDVEPGYDPSDLFMYDWMFHFNPYTKQWAAIPKDLKYEYWEDYHHPQIIRSKSINTLIELLHKTKGDVEKLEKLVNARNK